MSKLIDTFIDNGTQVEIAGIWYIAKPLNKQSVISRIRDCFRILSNSAIAVHYKEDERTKQ